MKQYIGDRQIDGTARVTVRRPDQVRRLLDPRLDLARHSPSGLEWGFGGSGPAQLALALAADVLGDDRRALAVHQDLKWELTARLPATRGWARSEAEILRLIESIEARRSSAPAAATMAAGGAA
ncbi:MAG TPA: DUF6166 domain-containing protein [Afifellaceae bacterium]|nr:DUF6166 domain-containing protein [Afifellaceae bacterium]